MYAGIAVTADALFRSFLEMKEPEFEKLLTDTVTRGEAFAQRDDAAYVVTLDEDEQRSYAANARFFLEALEELKQMPKDLDRPFRAAKLAAACALWNALSNFKTMHGDSAEQ